MKHQTASSGDVPFYKIGTFGGIPDAYINRDVFEFLKSQYPYPRKGQVLLSAAGTIGRSVIFDGKDAYFQDSNIVWIDAIEDVVNNSYLHYCFKYVVDWNQSKTSGSIIPRLYNNDLREISIPLPPLLVQEAISLQVGSIEKQIVELEASIGKSENIKASVVKKYI